MHSKRHRTLAKRQKNLQKYVYMLNQSPGNPHIRINIEHILNDLKKLHIRNYVIDSLARSETKRSHRAKSYGGRLTRRQNTHQYGGLSPKREEPKKILKEFITNATKFLNAPISSRTRSQTKAIENLLDLLKLQNRKGEIADIIKKLEEFLGKSKSSSGSSSGSSSFGGRKTIKN